MPEQKMKTGTLYLIPTPLIPYSPEAWEPDLLRASMPAQTAERLGEITHFVVESEKSAARFLSRMLSPERYSSTVFYPLDEHSSARDLDAPLAALLQGRDCAVLSEAGMPCVADPGAALVAAAHRAGIRVFPMGNDSSIIMALAASGLNGQSFIFLGYLPRGGEALHRKLAIEGNASLRDGASRIFIETPYRNSKTLRECVAALPDTAHLCVAGNLGTDAPLVRSAPISAWKKESLEVPEIPAVFCFGAPATLPRGDAERRGPRLSRREGRGAP